MSKYATLIFYLISLSSVVMGQYPEKPITMEEMINSYLDSYPIDDNNKFKVATYAELKGYYSPRSKSLRMEFGNVASLTFYERNCLLKVNQQYFYLNLYDDHEAKVDAFNQELAYLFQYINLMGDYGANNAHITFVNKWLARKSIEPFDKIFTRHILLKYGKYDYRNQKVLFHTDWLPDRTYAYRGMGDKSLVVKPISPLKMELDSVNLRGWYIKVGGYVYVEDTRHNVMYATGEHYTHNLSAFKLFAQKLFVQTAQQVVKQETVRLNEFNAEEEVVGGRRTVGRPSNSPKVSQSTRAIPASRPRPTRDRSSNKQPDFPALYNDKNWIPMMLNMLKEQNVKVTDPSVLQHLINKPYFEEIYDYLSPQERKEVDKYDWRR